MRRPTQCWLYCRHACWISCLKQFQSFRLWQQSLYCIALIMWMYLRLAWFLRVSVFFSKIKHLVFLCSSVCFAQVFLLYTYASCYWNFPCEFLTEISSCRILNEIVSFVTELQKYHCLFKNKCLTVSPMHSIILCDYSLTVSPALTNTIACSNLYWSCLFNTDKISLLV